MILKRLVGTAAIAGVVGASTLGIGAGIANANPTQSNSGTVAVQPADWHGGHARGWGHGYGHDYHYGWNGNPWWHPWGWPWRW